MLNCCKRKPIFNERRHSISHTTMYLSAKPSFWIKREHCARQPCRRAHSCPTGLSMTIEIPKTIIIVENLGPFIGLGYRLFGAKGHKDT